MLYTDRFPRCAAAAGTPRKDGEGERKQDHLGMRRLVFIVCLWFNWGCHAPSSTLSCTQISNRISRRAWLLVWGDTDAVGTDVVEWNEAILQSKVWVSRHSPR